MFLVGGSILAHGLAPLEHMVEAGAALVPGAWHAVAVALLHALVGAMAGMLVLAMVEGVQRLRRRARS
jgi:predicted DNA repair protein MutK